MYDNRHNTDSDHVFEAQDSVEKEIQALHEQDKKKDYEQIVDELRERHAYGEIAAKEHAKEALEELYHNEFPIEDPPDSYERYEAEAAVRALRVSVESLENVWGDTTTYVIPPEGGVRETEVSEMPDRDDIHEAVTKHHIKIAKDTIDVMETYGQLAEPHIAALAQRGLPSEVREYAIESLADLREGKRNEPEKSLSLREAIGRWLMS